MVLLGVEDSISAQKVSQIIGMDKGSVSPCFKSMQAKGLIELGLEASDGRLRIATLTAKGRALHDQIRGIALERERALLSVLSDGERESLLALLKRLHENLPEVELATQRYVDERFPGVAGQATQMQTTKETDSRNDRPARTNQPGARTFAAMSPSYTPSTRTKSMRQVLPERLAQAWLVPRCTTTLPCFSATSPLSSTSVSSPSITTP